MKSVSLKVLKNKLNEYVRLAAAGETVLVTDHDRVVAQITGALRYWNYPRQYSRARCNRSPFPFARSMRCISPRSITFSETASSSNLPAVTASCSPPPTRWQFRCSTWMASANDRSATGCRIPPSAIDGHQRDRASPPNRASADQQ